MDRGLSIFGKYPYAKLAQGIGTTYKFGNTLECSGAFDRLEPIVGVSDYVRIHGWLFDKTAKSFPMLIRFINEQGIIVGFALSGAPRGDVAKVVGPKARLSGYTGYIQTPASDTYLAAIGDAPDCKNNFYIPPQIVKFTKLVALDDPKFLPNISISSVIENLGFTGTDFDKTEFNNLIVYGSFVNADSDKGRIRLLAQKGDHFYYRSGPTGGQQILRIPKEGIEIILPVTLEWASIEFYGSAIPGEFEFELVDNGDGWGEWSAIGLVKGTSKN